MSLSDLKVVLNVLLEKEISRRGDEIVTICVEVTLKMVGVVFIHSKYLLIFNRVQFAVKIITQNL